MKKVLISVISILAVALTLCMSACTVVASSEQLATAQTTTSLPYSERNDSGLLDIKSSANAFAYDFSEQTYSLLGGNGNFAVAPISVYMALSIAAECASEQTRAEILSALRVSYEALKNDFSKLYRSLIFEYNYDERLIGKLTLTNSIWLNSGMDAFSVKNECLDSLSSDFFCHSFSADFTKENRQANEAVKQFVKEQTNDLIKKDFNFSKDVSFILMNTLYLRDLWNRDGEDLKLTTNNYDFAASKGKKSVKFLMADYSLGRAYEEDTFTHFYAATADNFKIRFILPKDGYSVSDVFTAENIEKVSAMSDYNAFDDENLICYNTRCLFPEFEASFDKNVKDVLANYFNINSMFDPSTSNFSALSDMKNYCSQVRHTTSLTVNKMGIEGAAVTVLELVGAAGPGKYTDVYNDFVVDRSFGFVITNASGAVIFTGVVNEI